MPRHQARKTAGELLAELEQRPEYTKRRRLQTLEEEENRRRYADAAAELFKDLSAAGFSVQTLAQLRRRGVGNRGAIAALIDWLPRVNYPPLKHDLIATLGSSWARPIAAPSLIREFRRIDLAHDTGAHTMRWSIADALERVADDSVADDLINIARDKRHGSQRGLVVVALAKMKNTRDRAIPVLMELLDDDDVAGYAVIGLTKLKAHEARGAILQLLDHPNSWVRAQAKKSVSRLSA